MSQVVGHLMEVLTKAMTELGVAVVKALMITFIVGIHMLS
jgi:hypothetical protein